VDKIAPVISEVTAIAIPNNNPTPSYVFTSSKAGIVSSNHNFTSPTNITAGINIHHVLANTAEGSYSNITITVTDAAGNISNILTMTEFEIDTVPPTMTISAAEVYNGDISNNAAITLTFASNEATTNFENEDITVTGGTLSTLTANSSKVYTATFTPSDDGACTIYVAASKFTDLSNNGNTVSNTFTWTYDGTSPTMTITSNQPANSIINVAAGQAYTLKATFAASENTSTFLISSITAINCSISNLLPAAGLASVYTADVALRT